jgi:hypothetical protein
MAGITSSSILILLLAGVVSAGAQSRYPALEREPACQTLMPAAAGGPLPRNPDVIIYLGVSNYELAYMDTARPRPQPNRALGRAVSKDAATLGDTNALL